MRVLPILVGVVVAASAWASDPPAPAAEGASPSRQVRIVVEPGKPMQYEVVEPAPEARKVEPCRLEGVKDRRAARSSDCLRCHDGSRTPEVPDARNGHVFDVPYQPVLHPNLRRDPEKFNSALVLVDETVTCLSCHDPASKETFHLAGPMSGPVEKRFCVGCHPRE
ncbi:MAG TPA: hypothetical protein VMK42_17045 [Anaeromyxobacteraceae bacterium]|nr:hypothetical protein [Anaeromyxobacteraceae bacterium]